MSIEKIKQLREMTGAGMMDVKNALEASDWDIDAAAEWLRANGIAKAAKKSGRIAAEGSIFVAKSDSKAVIVEVNSETDFVATNDMFVEGSQKITEAILASDLETDDLAGALALSLGSETVEESLTNLTATIGEKIALRRFAVGHGVSAVYKHFNGKLGAIVLGENIEEEVLKDVAMHASAMAPTYLSTDDISQEIIDKETSFAKDELAAALEGKPEQVQEGMIKGKVNKVLAESVLFEQAFVKDESKKVKDLQGSGKITSFVRYEVGEGIEKKVDDFAAEVAQQAEAAKQAQE